MVPRGAELVDRYKRNYGIPAEAEITEEMVLAHWALEKRLTRELLDSTSENRAETFERCYAHLYGELTWLNRFVGQADPTPPEERYKPWIEAIGSPPLSVYEIGSGKGDLIAYLSRRGFKCKGTEITRERGEKHQSPDPNLSWGTSDGVHLASVERAGTFDLVISDQVIEHLHPADLKTHLRNVHAILAPDGRYVISTPHRFTGPHDVSRVFRSDRPEGMHLKEYTYRELVAAAHVAGFQSVHHVGLPSKLRRLLLHWGADSRRGIAGVLYLRLLLIVELFLMAVPGHRLRCVSAQALDGTRLFNGNIFLALRKGD